MLSERARARLHDIIEDTRRIAVFIDGMSVIDFVADDRTVFAVERALQRITEAAIHIPTEDAAQLGAGFPIAQMRALGNRLRHEYRDIHRPTVFDIASREVPALESAAEIALAPE